MILKRNQIIWYSIHYTLIWAILFIASIQEAGNAPDYMVYSLAGVIVPFLASTFIILWHYLTEVF